MSPPTFHSCVPLRTALLLAGLLGMALLPAQADTPAATTRWAGSGLSHTVRAGESPAQIVRAMGLNSAQWRDVAQYNQIDQHTLPAAGTVLQVPLTLLRSQSTSARLMHTVGHVTVNGQPAHAGAQLPERSRIATGANSSAKLVLADGSEIRLLPQTIATVELSRHYQAPDAKQGSGMVDWFAGKMRLVQGALEAAVETVVPRAQPLQVETTTSLIGVRGTRFRVAAADPTARQDRAEVLQGTVNNANTWKNSSIMLPAGHGAVVDPNVAEMRAVPLPAAPALPADSGSLRLPDAVWSFPPMPGYSTYRIIVAQDPLFNEVIDSQKIVGHSYDMRDLDPGVWHLRIRAVNPAGLEGLDADTRVTLLPSNTLVEKPSLYLQDDALMLRWNRITLTHMPKAAPPVAIAATVFRDAALTQALGGPASSHGKQQVALPQLAPGRYWLRLDAVHPQLVAPPQQVLRVDIPANMASLAYHVLPDNVASN